MLLFTNYTEIVFVFVVAPAHSLSRGALDLHITIIFIIIITIVRVSRRSPTYGGVATLCSSNAGVFQITSFSFFSPLLFTKISCGIARKSKLEGTLLDPISFVSLSLSPSFLTSVSMCPQFLICPKNRKTIVNFDYE